jgi:GDPmannose 4,6-dehydratase
VHVTGLTHFLQTLAEDHSPASFFYAASSLVFGDVKTTPQDESTPFRPRCIYGITKAAGVHICRFYRERHHVNASAGILYNHESPLRKRTFVSQKIVRAATAIASGSEEKLELGDLSARADWGYAPDFVDAMTRIVRVAEPDDYLIATGESHSVQDFVEVAFGRFGLDWRRHVVERPSLLVRAPVERVGNPARLRERTGWAPQVSFAQMVEILVDAAQRHNAA